MSLSKNKLKKEALKERLEQEEQGNSRKEDSRYLPFYNLKERETMKIVFLLDDDQQLYVKYRNHGGNLKLPGVSNINCCYHSAGESCPACQLSFQYHNEGDKENATLWRSKEHFIAQCVVVGSDIEVPENEDGNMVKLMSLPWKVKEKIVEAVLSGEIDDPSDHVFVLKKNVNSGGWNTYENSYFVHKPLEEVVPQEFFDAAEEGLINPYRLEDELPKATTADEVQEWLDAAMEKLENSKKSKTTASSVKDRVEKATSDKNTSDVDSSETDSSTREERDTSSSTEGESDDRAANIRERLRRRRTAE